MAAQLQQDQNSRRRPRRAAYRLDMLGRLQDRRGAPNVRTRAMAALVVLGLLVLTAPLVMVPLISWLAHQL